METSTKVLLGLVGGWLGCGMAAGVLAASTAADAVKGEKLPAGKAAGTVALSVTSGACAIGAIGVGIYKVAKAISN